MFIAREVIDKTKKKQQQQQQSQANTYFDVRISIRCYVRWFVCDLTK